MTKRIWTIGHLTREFGEVLAMTYPAADEG